jgi:lysophospholipid acyltransferase (LPLAT)-like uncharacterized protein
VAEQQLDPESARETARKAKQKKRRASIRHARRKLGAVTLPIVAPVLMRTLSKSWKLEELHRERFNLGFDHPGRLITLWHGRMLLGMSKHKGKSHRVLVSPSDDGSLVVPLLERFGYSVIRGSSNKRPERALREMLRSLREGGTIVITPDGPRGPRHQVNAGPAWMASVTGFPILIVGSACDRAWHLKSWDKFTIPRPRARVVLAYAEPLFVERGADEKTLQAASDELQRRLVAAEVEAFEHLGVERDW